MDLAPGYRELAPPPRLRSSVACVWVRVAPEPGDVLVLPDACSDVIWTQGRGTHVAGPDTAAQTTSLAAGETLVGIRFHPGAGGGALGLPLDELRDQRVDAVDVDAAYDLDPGLAPADVVRRMLAVAATRPADPLVGEAARVLAAQRRAVPSLAADLGVSERQLRRRFHAAVGYGPKTLARVLRFRRVVALVDQGRTDLAGVAVDAGYADQAHLTRECTRIAGMSPATLVRTRGA